MPEFTLDDALREAWASAPASEVILETIEIRHASFTTPIRVVKNHEDLEAVLEDDAPVDAGQTVTFLGGAFELIPPELVRASSPEFEIALDGVSGEIVPYLDQAAQTASLIEVTYRLYLASDPSVQRLNPPLSMVIRRVSAGIFRATAKAGFSDVANRKCPGEVYDTDRFVGLSA